MNDKKKDFQPVQSDIHSIVDLPIEAVLDYLSGLSAKKYEITIETQNSDEASFELRNRQSRDKIQLLVKGIVQRWNGTFTRIDSDIKIKISRYSIRVPFLATLLFILALPLVLYFIDGNTMAVRNFTLCFIPIAFLGLLAMTVMVNHSLQAFNMENYKVSKSLVQELVDELSVNLQEKAATLDFDGTDDNLELLLNEEKHKHFRMGTDGELDTP